MEPLDSQSLAPLEHSSPEHVAPATGAHPGTKSMHSQATAFLRLVGSLRHGFRARANRNYIPGA